MKTRFKRIEGAQGVTYRDLITNALASMMFLFLIAVFLINPPQKGESETDALGRLILTVVWQGDVNVDVDAWAQADKATPVGYVNKVDPQTFALIRDDLGTYSDTIPDNSEAIISKTIPRRAAFAVHLYSIKDRTKPPIKVQWEVTTMRGTTRVVLAHGAVELHEVGVERPLVVLHFDAKGKLTLREYPEHSNLRLQASRKIFNDGEE